MSTEQRAVHGLPVPLTPLVGRQAEMAEICALLRLDEVRLLTLVGPGGVGKTRLAVAAATAIDDDFADGVVAVSLGVITNPDLVGPAIARALGMPESGDQPIADQLAASIGDRELLLLLDNFEGVTSGASLLTGLLAACPRLKILVTSRVVLRLSAEHLYHVRPLATGGDASGSLVAPDAMQLFAERARAADAAFALTDANAPVVAAICRRLDGLPLAIELAAARIRLFPPDELLDRLERRLPLLDNGPQDAPPRHRTLTAAIDWSYELLPEAERRLFREIAVFAGGFRIDAVERVTGVNGAGVAMLVDHSLVRPLQVPGARPRFAMLETVREFALQRLAEAGEWEDTRLRHAAWCLDLVSAAGASLGTAEQQRWLRPLEEEHDNIRAAMLVAMEAGDGETLARLAGGMWPFWYARGYLAEGRLWLADALAGDSPSSLRISLVLGMGALAHAQGADDAVTLLEEALAAARLEATSRPLVLALTLLGAAERDRGNYDLAGSLLVEGLERARADEDAWATGMALNTLALLDERRGEYDRAATLLAESIALADANRDIWGKVLAVSNLAHLAHRQGDYDRAAALYEQGTSLYREIGDRRGEANMRTNLGRIAERLGELDRAVSLHTESLETTRALGDQRGTATALANRGVAHLRRGDLGEAERDIRESLELRSCRGDREGASTSLEKLAEVALARGQAQRAIRLWAAAAAVRDAIGAPLAPAERASYDLVMTGARSLLSADLLAGTWSEGRSLPLDAAVREALADESVPNSARPHREARATSGLTPRELDVLRLLEEHTDREIAERLSIGARTVATHVTSILNKLGVNTRTAAVATAIRHGLI